MLDYMEKKGTVYDEPPGKGDLDHVVYKNHDPDARGSIIASRNFSLVPKVFGDYPATDAEAENTDSEDEKITRKGTRKSERLAKARMLAKGKGKEKELERE
jgi:hypothetical protein